MGLTVKTDDKGVMVFRQDKETQSGKAYTQYSLGVGSKDIDGNWVNGFVDCQFKKGVSVDNKTKIIINNAFYIVNEYNEKKYLKLMITDFSVLEAGEKKQEPTRDTGFLEIPEGIENELPFE